MFVADRCENPVTLMEALRMAYKEIKKGEDTRLHREVAQRMIAGRLGPDYELDLEWADAVDRRSEHRKEKLYSELNSYKTNLIKEIIRMGYNDFGGLHFAHGMLDVLECDLGQHRNGTQFIQVTNYVSKAEQVPEVLDLTTITKLKCAGGTGSFGCKEI
ncbi:COP9 signalosome complex subunit 1 [Acorus calamus]|uniref:COP9 signalosome complex subunit 1 n=1 Tax=Acorus calamus TaxID=4465 RepID=A0AAV9DSE6_ACOCL|nr:COP9 signalosome complex subunit 1 [Acorus calamus]